MNAPDLGGFAVSLTGDVFSLVRGGRVVSALPVDGFALRRALTFPLRSAGVSLSVCVNAAGARAGERS